MLIHMHVREVPRKLLLKHLLFFQLQLFLVGLLGG
jgi:hypothetical protein